MHLRIRALELERGAPVASTPVSPNQIFVSPSALDISRHVALAPPFRESEVDSYFGTQLNEHDIDVGDSS